MNIKFKMPWSVFTLHLTDNQSCCCRPSNHITDPDPDVDRIKIKLVGIRLLALTLNWIPSLGHRIFLSSVLIRIYQRSAFSIKFFSCTFKNAVWLLKRDLKEFLFYKKLELFTF